MLQVLGEQTGMKLSCIKPTSKVRGLSMVMSKEIYLTEAHKQLMDQRYYRRLDQDLTTHHAEQITSLIRTTVENEHIPKETGKYLTPTNTKTASFYHLPKIHKPRQTHCLIMWSTDRADLGVRRLPPATFGRAITIIHQGHQGFRIEDFQFGSPAPSRGGSSGGAMGA